MVVELRRHRFSRDEYHRMGRDGLFPDGARVELIEGDVCEMSPIGLLHMATVDRTELKLKELLGRSAIVRVQGAVALDDSNEPQPDVAVLRYRDDFYAWTDASPDAILLLIEVADTTLDFDLRVKAPLYARAGVPELWVTDVNRRVVIVHREPRPDGYASSRIYRAGELITPVAMPHVSIAIDDILPPSPSAA
jgi:Uma2 family endonuclease